MLANKRVSTAGTPGVSKSALATGFLIQLGNGDNFIFDLGTGSYVNLFATGVHQDTLTKVCDRTYRFAAARVDCFV